MSDQPEVLALMNIQEKESETYFTQLFSFTESQKQFISSLGLYSKVMSGNRIRIYGDLEQRRKALQYLSTEYSKLLEDSNNTQPVNQNPSYSFEVDAEPKKMPQQTRFQMKQEKKEAMKKYRCAGGCSATPLGW